MQLTAVLARPSVAEVGPSLGAWGLFRLQRLPTYSRLIAHFCSNNRPRTSLLLRAARVLATPASTAEGPRSRAARAAERPAAPVRLGRGGEPPGLISPSGVFPSPEIDKLLLWTDMSNPDDDTDVPSGFNDDAEMERTSPRTSESRGKYYLRSKRKGRAPRRQHRTAVNAHLTAPWPMGLG